MIRTTTPGLDKYRARWAPVSSDSEAALALEDGFSRDLNGDGVIGEPPSPIERFRYRLQQVAPSSNSREPFSAVFSGGPSADVIVAATFNALLSGSDLITGLPLQPGAIDLLDGGTESSRNNMFGPGPGRRTFMLSSITNAPLADDGDAGYVLIRNYDPLNDDLVVASDLPLTTALRPPRQEQQRPLRLRRQPHRPAGRDHDRSIPADPPSGKLTEGLWFGPATGSACRQRAACSVDQSNLAGS